jgi:hypothetical protein
MPAGVWGLQQCVHLLKMQHAQTQMNTSAAHVPRSGYCPLQRCCRSRVQLTTSRNQTSTHEGVPGSIRKMTKPTSQPHSQIRHPRLWSICTELNSRQASQSGSTRKLAPHAFISKNKISIPGVGGRMCALHRGSGGFYKRQANPYNTNESETRRYLTTGFPTFGPLQR